MGASIYSQTRQGHGLVCIQVALLNFGLKHLSELCHPNQVSCDSPITHLPPRVSQPRPTLSTSLVIPSSVCLLKNEHLILASFQSGFFQSEGSTSGTQL